MLLAIDTATSTASLALYDLSAAQLVAELTWQARRRQTEELLVVARTLLTQLELTPQHLTALAVTTGPGSFTGVRIGVSTVKGIALGLPNRPRIIGIPTLCVTAAPWQPLLNGVMLCAYMQAGRGRYNWAWFSSNEPRRVSADEHKNGSLGELLHELARYSDKQIWLVGENTRELGAEVGALTHVLLLDEVSSSRRAGHLARLAALRLSAGDEDSLAELQPLYLRSP